MELLAGDRLGKYEVVGRLAAGGMAEVYLARSLGHAGFAKVVALKRMLPELASEPGFREMFMQEASVAARLNHPNIVQIFDFAEEHGELYIAMEFVHGVTLRALHGDSLARGSGHPERRLTPLLAAHVGRCIARALAHAWQAPDEDGRPSHLIHRDVSPHNVLISYEGDAKLADFGIARPAERRTSVGGFKGKLLYMAPEQLLGGVLDARTDVFALGIVLYETALGVRKPLFEAGCEAEVKQALQARLIVPPDRMDPDFPKSVAAVIMKALDRDPQGRFQSAAEFVEALGEAIHREARCPLDCDLAAFMRRLYGDPPPIRGLRPATGDAPAAAAARAEKARSELERRGDDPFAATIKRAQAEALRELPAVDNGKQTKREGRGAPAARQEPAAPSEPAQPTARGRLPLRIGLALGAVSLAIGAVSLLPDDAEPEMTAQATDAGMAAAARSAPAARNAEAPRFPAPSPAAPSAKQAAPVSPVASLERKMEPTPPAAPAHGVERAVVAADPPAPRKATGEKPRSGTLVVHAKPWAFVWVGSESFTGDRDQEASPVLKRALPAGRHVVHLQEPSGRRHSRSVTVRAGQEVKVEESFISSP